MAITNKYDPEAQGYTFDKVINVQEQIVAGVNYDIVIEYSNGQGSYQIYDVMLYVVYPLRFYIALGTQAQTKLSDAN